MSAIDDFARPPTCLRPVWPSPPRGGWLFPNPWLHAALEGYSQLVGLILAATFLGRFYYYGRHRDLLIAAGFLATGLRPGPQSLEDNEQIHTQILSQSKILSLIRENRIVDAKSIATLLKYFAAPTRNRQR